MAEVNKVMLNIREFGKAVRDVLSSPEASQKWLKDLHDSLLYGIEGVSQFGDAMRNEALQFVLKKSNDGRKGGLARAINAGQKLKNQQQPTKPPTKPPTKDELYDFAEEQFIDDGIARQFWEICKSRNWCDKKGKKIGNWKGALINFSKTMDAKI